MVAFQYSRQSGVKWNGCWNMPVKNRALEMKMLSSGCEAFHSNALGKWSSSSSQVDFFFRL